MANLSVSIASGNALSTVHVTLTGIGTLWLTNSPILGITGTGNSIVLETIVDDTHATATITCGPTNGLFIISDSFSGVSCTFAIPTLVSYVLASSATALAEDTSLGDIDPGRAIALPEDTSLGDIDPTRTTVIQ